MTKEGFFFTYFYISRNVYSCALEYVTQFITCYHGQIRIMSKQLNIDLFVNPSFGFVMVVLATLRHFLRSFHKYVQKKKYWQLSGGFWRKLSDHALVTLNRAELSLKDKKILLNEIHSSRYSIVPSTMYIVSLWKRDGKRRSGFPNCEIDELDKRNNNLSCVQGKVLILILLIISALN